MGSDNPRYPKIDHLDYQFLNVELLPFSSLALVKFRHSNLSTRGPETQLISIAHELCLDIRQELLVLGAYWNGICLAG